MTLQTDIPKKQRALVLQGGGALGAYEAGVIKEICRWFIQEEKEKEITNSLLFDVIAGTSIGAMNGAVFVSQFLQTGSWERSSEKVEEFWNDSNSGLGSYIDAGKLPQLDPWQTDEKWYKQVPCAASKETARRYYSVKYFVAYGAPKVHTALSPRPDSRFYDNDGCFSNKWFVHSNDKLRSTILTYAKFPILTSFHKKQPRLLVFSVDVADGRTIAFDSYKKTNNPKGSQQERQENGCEDAVIKYGDDGNGILIDHVMASGTLPEFYDFQDIGGRKFCDGGLRSNTPFRELLQAHQSYWKDVLEEEQENESKKIPDLEVYLVNLHPLKQDTVPSDHDGVKDRINDIIFSDRTSCYDENVAYLITDYTSFTVQLKKLVKDAISKVNEEADRADLQKRFEAILATTTTSKDQRGLQAEYKDLIKCQFELTRVMRIEHTNYTNSISGKTGDFTLETINDLIRQGESDALNSLSRQEQ